MKIFEHPNTSYGWLCPICGSSEDKTVTFVEVFGTSHDGICEAHQYHVDCIELVEMEMGKDRALYLTQRVPRT
jgi:hypothetical protein